MICYLHFDSPLRILIHVTCMLLDSTCMFNVRNMPVTSMQGTCDMIVLMMCCSNGNIHYVCMAGIPMAIDF